MEFIQSFIPPALALIGGLCLFLFGMNVMGSALERRAGNSLRSILGKLTNNPLLGLITGMGVTAVIQSSSATTVMVVGFVNSGLMTLRQAIGVIMGANIGTTVTAWVLSLSGIESSNFFVSMLKPTSFTPILALIGILFYMFGKNSKRKDTAMILLGFATLMYGMEAMSGAVSGLKDNATFQALFTMFENPILGVLAGAILTAVIQSSSASVGILQVLAGNGGVTYAAAIPIIMGQNIGTCVTALLSSIGATKNAKRAAFVHLSFNVFGSVILLILFSVVRAVFHPILLDQNAGFMGIAVAHSLFNVSCTVILFPMGGFLEKFSKAIIPESKLPEVQSELDERLLATPAIALERCHVLATDMAKVAFDTLRGGISSLKEYSHEKGERIREQEERTDHYEDILSTYLVKLSYKQLNEKESAEVTKLLKMIGDFERISDHGVNILESAEELREKEIGFSPAATAELNVICDAVEEIMDLTLGAFLQDNIEIALQIEPLEQIIDDLKETLRTQHIKRLQQGNCSIDAGFVWSDLLTNLERCSDHCSNIAACLMEMNRNDMSLHELMRDFRANNSKYQENLTLYAQKYALP